jgi:DNA-binding MarR family transcriptional regulator
MSDSGWIVKEIDREDKRYIRVHLSKKARKLKDSLIHERERANEELLENLSLEEKLLLKRLLRDLQPET